MSIRRTSAQVITDRDILYEKGSAPPVSSKSMDLLVVGGGGAGGYPSGDGTSCPGGGGAGALMYKQGLPIPESTTTYTVAVGAGAPGGTSASPFKGEPSSVYTGALPTFYGAYLDGSGDYIRCDAAIAGFTSATDPWTIECIANSPSSGDLNTIISVATNTGAYSIALLLNSWMYLSGTMYSKPAFVNLDWLLVNNASVFVDKYVHYAISYDGVTLRAFRQGRIIFSLDIELRSPLSDCNLALGTEPDASSFGSLGNYNIGTFANLRVSDVCRYTAGFTPPYNVPEVDANTVLLALTTATGEDVSGNDHTVVFGGDASMVTFSGAELPPQSVNALAYSDGGGDGAGFTATGYDGGCGGGGGGRSGAYGGNGYPAFTSEVTYAGTEKYVAVAGVYTGIGSDGGRAMEDNTSGDGGGGGGGGAGSCGVSGKHYGNGVGGEGGDGFSVDITGTPTYYAGGGGGQSKDAWLDGTGAPGGLGGGGQGSVNNNGLYGSAGEANTGGGGGGKNLGGFAGGSGVVIFRTLETASATTGSPTVTTDGAYNIYKFTGSGTITF